MSNWLKSVLLLYKFLLIFKNDQMILSTSFSQTFLMSYPVVVCHSSELFYRFPKH